MSHQPYGGRAVKRLGVGLGKLAAVFNTAALPLSAPNPSATMVALALDGSTEAQLESIPDCRSDVSNPANARQVLGTV